jgi:hypothetical protein
MRRLPGRILALAACFAGILEAGADGLQPGHSLPGVVLQDVDSGVACSLQEWRGQPVLLLIFASW